MYNKLITLLEHGPFIFHSIDENGVLVHVSDQWLEFFGYTKEEVIGEKSTEFLTEESKKYATEVVLPEYFKTGVCKDVEYEFIKKDKSTANMKLSAITASDNDKKYSIAVLTDVTETVETKKELEQHRDNLEELIRIRTEELHTVMDMYRTLAKMSPVAIMRTNKHGDCEFINKKWTELTHQTKEEAKDRGWLEAIYTEDRKFVEATWDIAVINKQNWSEEFRIIDKEGCISWVICSGNVINGGGSGHVITFTNITKRKEILPQLLDLQRMMKKEPIKRCNTNGD